MHYAIALLLWLALIIWIVRVSASSGADAPDRRDARRVLGGWLAMAGAGAAAVAVVAVSIGVTLPSQPELGAGMQAWPDPTPLAARLPASSPSPDVVQAELTRVRVRTGANVRAAPSRAASVLRVARQGDVLRRFGGTNGWIQVGVLRPEGWIAESVAAPAI